MKTKIIKIDRKSVKRNPRAFSTSTNVLGSIDISFNVECPESEFKVIEGTNGVYISTWSYTQNGNIKAAGYFDDSQFDFAKLPGKWNVEYNRNISTINHFPDPEWLYDYEKTKVPCESCGKNIVHTKIETDCNDDGCFTICPKCSDIDTFDFKYEDIYDVVKELNL